MRFYCFCLFRLLNSRGHTLTIDIVFNKQRFSSEYRIQNGFYTFKVALNRTTIKLYSMANTERAMKAVLAKRGLEYSIKDETFKCTCISAIVKL